MPDDLFATAGALRGTYAEVDWATTPLGPTSAWSPALRAALDVVLHTQFPMTLLWGPAFVLVYNEAYVTMIGDKHPAALGAPAQQVFPEAWDAIGPMLQGVLAGEGATFSEDLRLLLQRRGLLEETFFTFSYSPVRGRDGAVEGVLDIATETTEKVVGRRRLELLSRLEARLGDVTGLDQVRERALPLLRAAHEDLPAVDVRLPGAAPGGSDADLPGSPAAPWAARDALVEQTPRGRVAWLPVGQAAAPAQPGVLVALVSPNLPADDAYLSFLGLVAASLGRALDRVRIREAERGISEALQRSLLTTPPSPDDLEVAVRYSPAAEQAQVGGDWYDSFLLPDGSLTLVIGDVTGHDRQAAAAMGQVRNLLRGVSYTLQEPPARVLTGLDEAMHGLAVGVFATAVLAQVQQVEPEDAGPGAGRRTLRWSNAGHPPPVLLSPDGSARLLDTPPDLLLGLAPDTPRADHSVPLEPGASVVLYTDGLVERRGTPLQEGLGQLVGSLRGRQRCSAQELCDHLLAAVGADAEDDVALLVLRA